MTTEQVMAMDEDVWLDYLRTRGIGGSLVGALLGVDGWLTPAEVWDRVVGVTDTQREPSRIALRGIALEPFARRMFASETGRLVRELNGKREHPAKRYLTGRVDGWMPPQDAAPEWSRGAGVLEIKVLGMASFDQTVTSGIDPAYHAQNQHYQNVLGLSWGSFAVLSPERWELHWFDVARDDALIARIEEACDQFWHDHVIPRRRPSLDESARAAIPGDIVRARVGGELTQIDDPRWLRAAQAFLDADREIGIHEYRKAQAIQRLKELMDANDADAARGGGLRVYWREQHRRSVDTDRLFRDHPDIDPQEYLKITVTRPFRPYSE